MGRNSNYMKAFDAAVASGAPLPSAPPGVPPLQPPAGIMSPDWRDPMSGSAYFGGDPHVYIQPVLRPQVMAPGIQTSILSDQDTGPFAGPIKVEDFDAAVKQLQAQFELPSFNPDANVSSPAPTFSDPSAPVTPPAAAPEVPSLLRKFVPGMFFSPADGSIVWPVVAMVVGGGLIVSALLVHYLKRRK